MIVRTLRDESKIQNGFYVPQYEIRVEGVGLPGNVLRDVRQLTYKDNIKEIDSFEITVNNWDPDTQSFKYVGAETEDSLKDKSSNPLRFCMFEPSKSEVQIYMGYVGKLQLMMTGSFTTMEPNFPRSGASTLNVRGLNVLHKLRRKQYTQKWPDRKDSTIKDSEIAEEIGKLHDKKLDRKRFPIPIKIDDNAKEKEPPLESVSQQNQYDIDFLFSRARERGYVVTVNEGEDKNKKKFKKLYFGPSQKTKNEITYELEWGKSLLDFKPTLTSANQVLSVTVNGWNRRKKERISARVTLKDSRIDNNRDLHKILMQCDPREEEVIDEPVFTKKQARERALAILMERQKEMVKANGTTVGLPDLRTGKRLIIKGLGRIFNGIYFVTETTHTINDNGYITSFKARRENKEGVTKS